MSNGASLTPPRGSRTRPRTGRARPSGSAAAQSPISSLAAASSASRPSSSPRSLRRRSSSSTSPTRGDSGRPSSARSAPVTSSRTFAQAREPVAKRGRVVRGQREQGGLGRAAGEVGDLDRVGRPGEPRRQRDRLLDGALRPRGRSASRSTRPRVLGAIDGEAKPPARRAGIELVAQCVEALDERGVGARAPRTRRAVRACARRRPRTAARRPPRARVRPRAAPTPAMPSRARRSVSASIRKPSRFS